ncbi:MAG: TatD family hydrolase [Paramuribaculum sp.]|nr:TatD family hydrolase [Paramuribaculum sp.]
MGWVDTHTHIYLPEFEDGGISAVERAIEADVDTMILPNVDVTTIAPMKELHSKFPDRLYMAMGLHPTSVTEDWESELQEIKSEINKDEEFCAIGEIGMDLYWDKRFRDQQMEIFEAQLKWAEEKKLPVIIHCREALDETLEVMESFNGITGVFHSFGGSVDDVNKIRRRAGDFHFGINGIVTFKNSGLRSVLPEIGSERIILETDAPYLSPVPFRGKRCESAYIIHTANYVADSLNMNKKDLMATTSASAIQLFSLKRI